MDSERKTVRVTIFNQTYTLAATDEAGEVETLAHTVDELMTSIAQRAAWRKSATVRRTSSTDNARGVGMSCIPVAVNIGVPGAIAADDTPCR